MAPDLSLRGSVAGPPIAVSATMGSSSLLNRGRSRARTTSAADKDMSGKLKKNKMRRGGIPEFGKKMPDYTELAYREAVSKLRYFLSPHHAPLVRSIGSGSIKNLDESEDDCRSSVGRYQPRPRLTSKYTALYADSLKNADTGHISPLPATVSAELPASSDPAVVRFIQKQDEYIEQLERESHYCRDELNNLLGKVKEVITENEHLHDAQKNRLLARVFHPRSDTDDNDSTGNDSDVKASPQKVRRSASSDRRLEGPNIVFESRISELEAQLAQANIQLKKVQEENNESKRKMAAGLVDNTCLDGFKRQIDNLQRDKSTLEGQVARLKLTLERRDSDTTPRPLGPSALEQTLREQRDQLEDEVRRLKEELSMQKSKVVELAGEGARRAMRERSAAAQRYTDQVDDLSHDLAAQYDNVAKLQLELERHRREESELKRELAMKAAAVDELKMELKNKTAMLQADMAQALAEKAALEEELAGARLQAERLARQHKHETNRLNSEIQSLRQRLDRADADLVHARRENLRLTENIAGLEKEIRMKELTPSSPVKEKKDKELTGLLESMESKHANTVAELESMIYSQNSLMEKLTGECRLLTDKLDDANRRHKEELAALHGKIEDLTITVGNPQQQQKAHAQYNAPANEAQYDAPVSRPDLRRQSSRNSTIGDGLRTNHVDSSSPSALGLQDGNSYTTSYQTSAPSNPQKYNPPAATEPAYTEENIKDNIEKKYKNDEPGNQYDQTYSPEPGRNNFADNEYNKNRDTIDNNYDTGGTAPQQFEQQQDFNTQQTNEAYDTHQSYSQNELLGNEHQQFSDYNQEPTYEANAQKQVYEITQPESETFPISQPYSSGVNEDQIYNDDGTTKPYADQNYSENQYTTENNTDSYPQTQDNQYNYDQYQDQSQYDQQYEQYTPQNSETVNQGYNNDTQISDQQYSSEATYQEPNQNQAQKHNTEEWGTTEQSFKETARPEIEKQNIKTLKTGDTKPTADIRKTTDQPRSDRIKKESVEKEKTEKPSDKPRQPIRSTNQAGQRSEKSKNQPTMKRPDRS